MKLNEVPQFLKDFEKKKNVDAYKLLRCSNPSNITIDSLPNITPKKEIRLFLEYVCERFGVNKKIFNIRLVFKTLPHEGYVSWFHVVKNGDDLLCSIAFSPSISEKIKDKSCLQRFPILFSSIIFHEVAHFICNHFAIPGLGQFTDTVDPKKEGEAWEMASAIKGYALKKHALFEGKRTKNQVDTCWMYM